jgi:hypothetical protein
MAILRFHTAGGMVDGQGRVLHDVWSGGRSAQRTDDTLTFTGTSDGAGNAGGTIAMTTCVFGSAGRNTDALAHTRSMPREASMQDGELEAWVISKEGQRPPSG